VHRRDFIRAASIAAGSGLLAACGGGDDVADLPGSTDDQTLFVQGASFEVLAGSDRWLAFGVLDLDNVPLPAEADVEVFLRRVATTPEEAGEIVAGPLPAEYAPAEDTGQGVWYLRTDLEETGFIEIVVRSGDDVGVAAIQVADPAQSRVVADGAPVVPGAMAISAPTPTTEDDRGVFSICTQDPPCGMHEVSLDDALASGSPVVVLFATPAYCQTVVCGPSVATLDGLRGDFADVVFVHSEIFAEEPTGGDLAGVPLTEAVQAWGLPTEPWLFTIGPDGVIRDRLDGPMPTPIVRTLLEELTA
jgi:hypothetical protein